MDSGQEISKQYWFVAMRAIKIDRDDTGVLQAIEFPFREFCHTKHIWP